MTAPVAHARDDDDRGRRSERWDRDDRGRGDRGRDGRAWRGRGDERPDSRRWVDQDRDDARRARIPALGYGDDRPDRSERRETGPRPRGFAPPSPRRGGYLPPDSYRGAVVQDYRRYRLRPPPQGYAWVRVGGGFALVSLADGRIFDMVD